MRRVLTLLAVCVVACGVVTPVLAQKAAPAVTRDSDRDGVPDTRDRCRGTLVGVRVDATGCPAAAAAPAPAPAPAPTTAPPPPTPLTAAPAAGAAGAAGAAAAPARGLPAPATTTGAAPATAVPAAGAPAAGAPATITGAAPAQTTPPTQQAAAPTQPTQQTQTPAPAGGAPGGAAPTGGGLPAAAAAGVAGAAAAVPQVARGNPPTAPAAQPAAPARAAAPVTDPTLTAGFWMPAYAGESDADMLEYARTLTMRVDSAIGALVEIFRNTTGAPVIGASGPNILSTREKGRWQRCRMIHFDIGTLGDGAAFLKDSLTAPALSRAGVTLSDAFEGQQATAECDNVVSMVEAPERWAPWQQNYESSARTFYRDWYAQLRAVHDANRAFARALNGALPAARQFAIFPALPPTPPTIGAVR